jgi:hypothetical protein
MVLLEALTDDNSDWRTALPVSSKKSTTEHGELDLAESVTFADAPSEEDVFADELEGFKSAVLHATDWTTETIVNQLKRGNIDMNPSFQRRDAWSIVQKSRFIESLALGLPIPQIVLAERKGKQGRFLVLDGKQRLLSLLQFWGLGEGGKNHFALTGLQALPNLNRLRWQEFEKSTAHEDIYEGLLNQSIRTVVIRNWPDVAFLHLVFLRLNTGSVKLSPQELRQAAFPGDFSTWIDQASASSPGIQSLLRLSEPDYRMRDVEILARFISWRFFLTDYHGRMRVFIDRTFRVLNEEWFVRQGPVNGALEDLELAIGTLTSIFGDKVARKPGSRSFNRAVFDALAFYAQNEGVRTAMRARPAAIRNAYDRLFDDPRFREAVERDTASVTSTVARIALWGSALSKALRRSLPRPELEDGFISFPGFE